MIKKVYFIALVLFSLALAMKPERSFADALEQFAQAEILTKNGQYQQAEQLYQDIITNYPDTDYVSRAQLNILRVNAFSLIESGNDSAVEALVNGMVGNFSGQPALAPVLYSIARKCEKPGKYDLAKRALQEILQANPEDFDVDRAQLEIFKIDAISCIESSSYEEAQQIVETLLSDFPGHLDLPLALYQIARRYEATGDTRATDIYQQIIQRCPESLYADKAQLDIQKMNILLLIQSGESAQAAVNNLVNGFSGNTDLPRTLYEIARKYDSSKEFQEATGIYQQVAQQYPGSSWAGKAQLHISKIDALSLINSGQTIAAQVATDSLIANFDDHPDMPGAIFRIGEEYYNTAFALESAGLDAEAKDHFEEAIAIWEKIIQELPPSAVTAQAYDFAAACYRRLGQYDKSTEYYQQVVDNWPNYEYAWNTLFMIGHNYQDLSKTGVISKSEANTDTKAAYELLVEKYPTCKVAKTVHDWLRHHNSN